MYSLHTAHKNACTHTHRGKEGGGGGLGRAKEKRLKYVISACLQLLAELSWHWSGEMCNKRCDKNKLHCKRLSEYPTLLHNKHHLSSTWPLKDLFRIIQKSVMFLFRSSVPPVQLWMPRAGNSWARASVCTTGWGLWRSHAVCWWLGWVQLSRFRCVLSASWIMYRSAFACESGWRAGFAQLKRSRSFAMIVHTR